MLRGKTEFKAHLLGFRGIGAAQNPWGDDVTKPIAPAVVLRLPNGRKRCFVRALIGETENERQEDKQRQLAIRAAWDNETEFRRRVVKNDLGIVAQDIILADLLRRW